jgi:Na+/melibiose symporter-like transporter
LIKLIGPYVFILCSSIVIFMTVVTAHMQNQESDRFDPLPENAATKLSHAKYRYAMLSVMFYFFSAFIILMGFLIFFSKSVLTNSTLINSLMIFIFFVFTVILWFERKKTSKSSTS